MPTALAWYSSTASLLQPIPARHRRDLAGPLIPTWNEWPTGMVTWALVWSAGCSGEGGGKRGEAQDVLGAGQVGEGDKYGLHTAVS